LLLFIIYGANGDDMGDEGALLTALSNEEYAKVCAWLDASELMVAFGEALNEGIVIVDPPLTLRSFLYRLLNRLLRAVFLKLFRSLREILFRSDSDNFLRDIFVFVIFRFL